MFAYTWCYRPRQAPGRLVIKITSVQTARHNSGQPPRYVVADYRNHWIIHGGKGIRNGGKRLNQFHLGLCLPSTLSEGPSRAAPEAHLYASSAPFPAAPTELYQDPGVQML